MTTRERWEKVVSEMKLWRRVHYAVCHASHEAALQKKRFDKLGVFDEDINNARSHAFMMAKWDERSGHFGTEFAPMSELRIREDATRTLLRMAKRGPRGEELSKQSDKLNVAEQLEQELRVQFESQRAEAMKALKRKTLGTGAADKEVKKPTKKRGGGIGTVAKLQQSANALRQPLAKHRQLAPLRIPSQARLKLERTGSTLSNISPRATPRGGAHTPRVKSPRITKTRPPGFGAVVGLVTKARTKFTQRKQPGMSKSPAAHYLVDEDELKDARRRAARADNDDILYDPVQDDLQRKIMRAKRMAKRDAMPEARALWVKADHPGRHLSPFDGPAEPARPRSQHPERTEGVAVQIQVPTAGQALPAQGGASPVPGKGASSDGRRKQRRSDGRGSGGVLSAPPPHSAKAGGGGGDGNFLLAVPGGF
eukprot:TRINITY_DN8356_c0_g1_i1.p1 TRINITY_DN8356_c0_g1~~TRINITY_DN8356_c0_g1_i1.p1  ORF type:complete len:424 (+),score=106.26 TRINITY_DN8356_c0_g1_i1:342-1613(+)